MLKFGTNGIRGKIHELNPEFVMDLGRAIGHWVKNKTCNTNSNPKPAIVATDYRTTREIYARAVISGLVSAGIDVVYANVLPSPVVEYYMHKGRYSVGIIITASHNPPEYNGIKVVDSNGIAISKETGEEIIKMINIGPVNCNCIGIVRKCNNLLLEYISDVINRVGNIKKDLKVVLDPGNGVMCDVLFAYQRLCNIIPINAQPDGRFPGRASEPTEENVRRLIDTVVDTKADLGIAWDGDGDRIILIDENGRYILGDKVFALSILGFGKGRKGKVITTVSTSRMIDDVAKMHGLETKYERIGAPYLAKRVAKEKEVAFAGEEVGGVIWPEISFAKDGIYTALKMLELTSKMPISEWINRIPTYHNKKVKIHCKREIKYKVIELLKEKVRRDGKKDGKIIDIDGVRVDWDDAWVIVRASGTEDVIRVFSEARTKDRCKEISERYVNMVRGIIKTIEK